MKISSKEQLIDFLSEDLGWRKKELYTHRLNLKMANSANQPIYLRSAVVMLYAHWEGFIKQAATSYLRFIKGQKLKLNEASTNIVALSLKQKINDFIGTNKPSLHIKFIKHLRSCDADRVMFTENDVIRTESNLSSKVLEEILYALAIPDGDYALKSNMIDTNCYTIGIILLMGII